MQGVLTSVQSRAGSSCSALVRGAPASRTVAAASVVSSIPRHPSSSNGWGIEEEVEEVA